MTKKIIEKWYKKLDFKSEYDEQFYEYLNTIDISPDTAIENYDLKCEDLKKNFLAVLYMCESVEKFYKEKGIGDDILTDTLEDIVRWTDVWTDFNGYLCYGEMSWIALHLKCKLYKLGRLQFAMDDTWWEVKELGIKEKDPVLGVHIPRDGSLARDKVVASLKLANEFFPKFFPEHKYRYFCCKSWLLDDTLKKILPPDSGIVTFGDMFIKIEQEPHDSILNFVFGKGATRDKIDQYKCDSTLTKGISQYIKEGKEFHLTRGYIKADDF